MQSIYSGVMADLASGAVRTAVTVMGILDLRDTGKTIPQPGGEKLPGSGCWVRRFHHAEMGRLRQTVLNCACRTHR